MSQENAEVKLTGQEMRAESGALSLSLRYTLVPWLILAFAIILAISGGVVAFLTWHDVPRSLGALVGIFILVIAIARTFQSLIETRRYYQKIDAVEELIRKDPKEPKLAWELAQTKLESYLNRNLEQARSIFWLTLVVMLAGFGFILFGILRAFDDPSKLPVAVIASASGVLISFIGGSFLIIYRATLAESKDFVAVLERINAVGMSVQIVENIPDTNAELKHATTAEIAKQLLYLYSTLPARAKPGPKE